MIQIPRLPPLGELGGAGIYTCPGILEVEIQYEMMWNAVLSLPGIPLGPSSPEILPYTVQRAFLLFLQFNLDELLPNERVKAWGSSNTNPTSKTRWLRLSCCYRHAMDMLVSTKGGKYTRKYQRQYMARQEN